MIHIRPGSQVYEILTLLSIVGEFPTCSLHLLGSERVYKALVSKLTEKQECCHTETGEVVTTKVLTVSGKGSSKTIRLFRKALPILGWLGAEQFYNEAYPNHKFSGSYYHILRNHRVAEVVAVCMKAGLEIKPYKLPKLQGTTLTNIIDKPTFYPSRILKEIYQDDLNKTKYTRIVGALFVDGECFAVYNSRNVPMKWSGRGEFKTKHALIDTGRRNAGVTDVTSALLFANDASVALATLIEVDKNQRKDERFDSIYKHIHFIPLTKDGIRQFRLFTIPKWQDKVLQLLFEDDQRSYGSGQFEYDAVVDGTYVFVHFDGDLARLIRYRDASQFFKGPHEVLCFPQQVEYIKSYLGKNVTIKTIDIDVIEEALGIGKELNER